MLAAQSKPKGNTTVANETVITIIGNMVDAPDLRFTQSGTAVADFTIASTPRTYDRQANEWRDGETLFLRCTAWKQLADNAAQTLRKGMRVIAQGRLNQRSYETRDGERRTVVELQVDEIGPSLRNATAQVTRNPQHQGSYSQGSYGQPQDNPWQSQQQQQPQQAPAQPQQSGWPQPTQPQQETQSTFSEQPPF